VYEKVWTVSLRKLAAEYRLSDVGMAKTGEHDSVEHLADPSHPRHYRAR